MYNNRKIKRIEIVNVRNRLVRNELNDFIENPKKYLTIKVVKKESIMECGQNFTIDSSLRNFQHIYIP